MDRAPCRPQYHLPLRRLDGPRNAPLGRPDAGGASIQRGLRFNPQNHAWTEMSAEGAPAARHGHTAHWAGTAMLVWGGRTATGLVKDTNLYTPPATFYLYQRP